MRPVEAMRRATLQPRAFGWALAIGAPLALAACPHGGGDGIDPFEPPGDQPAFPLFAFGEGHVQQADIASRRLRFTELFEAGDLLFETPFNALDGVGVLRLPDGSELPTRFSRVPPGGGRFTGPNGQACNACHNSPFPTSAGEIAANVLQDPSGTGVGPFNQRNTTSLFGSGALQPLAEEMTGELQAQRAQAVLAVQGGATEARVELSAKGVSFGAITVKAADPGDPLTPDGVLVDVSELEGVDPDLVVRPYGWKGNVTTLRDFVRGAAEDELGMQAEELVVKLNRDAGREPDDPDFDPDPDGDGVGADEPELTAGDVTAIVIYVAAQEIPSPLERLVDRGFLPPPTRVEGELIDRGRGLFDALGCAACHVPQMRLADPVFVEPTLRGNAHYFDHELAGDDASFDPARAASVHLVQEGDVPRLVPHPQGGARVELFGDLKRHRMGPQLADAQATPVRGADGRAVRVVIEDPLSPGTPIEVELLVDEETFLTPELWGVGNSGPWLHDGRAGSLEEAILLHGFDTADPSGPFFGQAPGAAQPARDAFAALGADDRLAVVSFLRSLLHFALPEAGE